MRLELSDERKDNTVISISAHWPNNRQLPTQQQMANVNKHLYDAMQAFHNIIGSLERIDDPKDGRR